MNLFSIAPFLALAVTACATSAVSRLEGRFVALGMEPRMAACLVSELDEDLSSREMSALADFIDKMEAADRGRPGLVVDTIMNMDNPEIVASMAAAGIACAFRR